MKTAGQVRSGALIVLSTCFLVSALLRAGEVVAALPAARDDGFGIRIPPEDAQATGTAGANAVGVSALVAELREQAQRLRTREEQLLDRERVLNQTERRLEARLEQLEALRLELEAETGRAASAAEGDVKHLAATYRAMKPKDAGRIFEAMEPSFAAGLLSELGADGAAQVLANMAPERAYAVSVLIAGRSLNRVAPSTPQR